MLDWENKANKSPKAKIKQELRILELDYMADKEGEESHKIEKLTLKYLKKKLELDKKLTELEIPKRWN